MVHFSNATLVHFAIRLYKVEDITRLDAPNGLGFMRFVKVFLGPNTKRYMRKKTFSYRTSKTESNQNILNSLLSITKSIIDVYFDLKSNKKNNL